MKHLFNRKYGRGRVGMALDSGVCSIEIKANTHFERKALHTIVEKIMAQLSVFAFSLINNNEFDT